METITLKEPIKIFVPEQAEDGAFDPTHKTAEDMRSDTETELIEKYKLFKSEDEINKEIEKDTQVLHDIKKYVMKDWETIDQP